MKTLGTLLFACVMALGLASIPQAHADISRADALPGLTLHFLNRYLVPPYSHRFSVLVTAPELRSKVAQIYFAKKDCPPELDLAGGKGSFNDDAGNQQDSFQADIADPLTGGEFTLMIALKDGSWVGGTVQIAHPFASANPHITAPSLNGMVGPTPTIQWDAFTSPEYQPGEMRSTRITINGGGRNWVNAALSDANETCATVGQGDLSQTPYLASGAYVFAVTEVETSCVQGLNIAREAYSDSGLCVR